MANPQPKLVVTFGFKSGNELTVLANSAEVEKDPVTHEYTKYTLDGMTAKEGAVLSLQLDQVEYVFYKEAPTDG